MRSPIPLPRHGHRRDALRSLAPRAGLAPLARLALAAAAVLAFHTALRVRRELSDFRRSNARLRREWCTVPAPAGNRRLRMHARVGDAAGPAGPVLPPIVLVHGWGIGSTYLVPLAGRLARYAHTYAPELPGHGESEHAERSSTPRELARSLGQWMDVHRLRSAIVVGHSLGGQVAAELAARRPDLVCGLVLVCPTWDPTAPFGPRLFARAARTAILEPPSCMLWAVRDYRRAGLALLASELFAMLEHRLDDVLRDVRVPVRVMRGSRDRIVPQRWAQAVARLACAPAPVTVEGSAHAVPYADPDAIVQVVRSLARELRATRA